MMFDDVNQQITSQEGMIVSHREYPHEDYPNSVDSTLRIEIDGMLLFQISVLPVFEFPHRYSDGNCFDYLNIGASEFCAEDLAAGYNKTFITLTGSVTIKFHANRRGRYIGFGLQYSYSSE